jgi:PKD domain
MRWRLWSAVVAGLASSSAVIAVALAPPVAAGTVRSAKWFGGVIRDRSPRARDAPIARIANLPYSGGPVLHSNRTHLIFWQPQGSGLSFEPQYESIFATFLLKVAADSHKPTNVYGLSGQYRDAHGPAAYATSYDGSVQAPDKLPSNGCVEPSQTGPGWDRCLNDTQLADEIEHVVTRRHLPTTWRDIYFLVLPAGLGACESSGPQDCALGGDENAGFCGYHSTTIDDKIRYAVIPYNAVPGHCQSDAPRPNASSADPSISTLSHEHNETVTDPLGNAWIDGSGSEDGDLCIARYGRDVGGSGDRAWNESIGGGHYYLQEEWSNQDHGCRPRALADVVSFSSPVRAVAHAPITFAASARAARGSIVEYSWFFGDGPIGRRRVVSHSFSHAGVFRVVLRSTDSAGNWAFSARTVSVLPTQRGSRHS